jgi:arsenate reductase
VQVMQEVGIDISREIPKLLTLELLEEFDRVITMGCGLEDTCPVSFLPTEDWGLDDPADKPLEEVRRTRDEIKTRVEKLVAQL